MLTSLLVVVTWSLQNHQQHQHGCSLISSSHNVPIWPRLPEKEIWSSLILRLTKKSELKMFLRYKNYLVVANLCTKNDKLRVVRFFWHVVDENPFIFDLCILFAEASGFLRASENQHEFSSHPNIFAPQGQRQKNVINIISLLLSAVEQHDIEMLY